ncbi:MULTISPECIES: entericidin A/B family lipoprotein [Salinicola]|uniref:Entericidin n=2 Tax=Salinicola TaxID=404432 RepID=A0A1Q8SUT3_9GAMM|nr:MULTISPECIES: entericidin A/B family lipoprotein [Salinicola]OLO05158.1 entericidin [Salinicola socius]OLO08039.1 entericidin [Salinicola sp. MH3R3-1]
MKRLIAFSLFALFSAGILAGCNTVDGAGKDIESGGEAVQDAAS